MWIAIKKDLTEVINTNNICSFELVKDSGLHIRMNNGDEHIVQGKKIAETIVHAINDTQKIYKPWTTANTQH